MREKRMRFKSGSYCRSFSFKSKKKERKKYISSNRDIYIFIRFLQKISSTFVTF